MSALNVEGLISITVFYLIIFAIGIFAAWKRFNRKQRNNLNEDSEGIVLAGRNVGLSTGAFTMTATWIGGVIINGTCESVYTDGLVWTLAPVGYALSLVIGGIFFAKKMREREYVTMLDPLQDQYGSIMGAVLFTPAFLGEVFWSASILSALGSTLCVVLSVDIKVALIASTILILVYTFLGGLYSVIYTDVVQLLMLTIGLFLTLPYALSHENVKSIASTKDKWAGEINSYETGKWVDFAMLLIFGGLPWQIYFQRVLSSRSPRTASLMSYAGAVGCLVLATPAVFLGAAAKSTDWNIIVNSTSSIIMNGSIVDTRLTLPLVIQYLTPPWVAFIGVGAILAAIMSSADSSFLSTSSMFGYNIYKILFRPSATDNEIAWVTRLSIIIVGVVSMSIGLILPSIHVLFYLCSDLIYVLLFPQLFAALYIPAVNSYGSIMAFAVGLFFRLTGGEKIIGLPAIIKYPMYKNNDQYFPFRTLAMILSFLTLTSVSYVTNLLFSNGTISRKNDIFQVMKRNERRYELRNRAAIMMTELNYRLSLRDSRVDHRRAHSVF